MNLRRKLLWSAAVLLWALVLLLMGGVAWRSLGAGPRSPALRLAEAAALAGTETNHWVFAATAQNGVGQESEFSNEVSVTVTNHPFITLAWDASPSAGVTNYNVYVGRTSGIYTNKVMAGTKTTQVLVDGRAAATNRLVTIKALSATGVSGPWSILTNWAPLMWTNPVGNRFLRLAVTLTNF